MRPMLLPGVHVLRRGDGRFQVGLTRGVVLPDIPPVRATLRLLATSAPESAYPDPSVLGELSRLVGDERAIRGAAVKRHRIGVATFGHASAEPLAGRLRSALTDAGLTPVKPGSSALVCVALGVGEPPRPLLDEWMQAGTPHILVRLVEGDAVVGPFVQPGRTACLRCLDAHAGDADPAWPLLLEQYVGLAAQDRVDGAAEPVDPLLAGVALSWAARDVASYLDGVEPSTWSATLHLDALLQRPEVRSWLRHPECGCSWSAAGGSTGTMDP